LGVPPTAEKDRLLRHFRDPEAAPMCNFGGVRGQHAPDDARQSSFNNGNAMDWLLIKSRGEHDRRASATKTGAPFAFRFVTATDLAEE
jgi:hypothetical protein